MNEKIKLDVNLNNSAKGYIFNLGLSVCDTSKTVACTLSENGKAIERCIDINYTCNGYNDCLRNYADDEYGCVYGGDQFSVKFVSLGIALNLLLYGLFSSIRYKIILVIKQYQSYYLNII